MEPRTLQLVAVGTLLGASYIDVLPANPSTESVRLVASLTLALILFADASTVKLRQAESDVGLPLRLLGIGLPLTMALGAVVARVVFPSISWPEAALIAAILAPTDAALGVAVVTNPMVPLRIRRALNIESGLNDGIATPFVTVFLAIVVAGAAQDRWGIEALAELARGAVIGIGIGYAGGRLARWAKSARWSTPLSDQLLVLSLAFLAYGAASSHSGTASSRRSSPASCSAPPRAENSAMPPSSRTPSVSSRRSSSGSSSEPRSLDLYCAEACIPDRSSTLW